MTTVFIDGREGTTGLRIFDRLANRPNIQLLTLDDTERKDPARRREMLHSADIAFLCLPDAAAQQSAALAEGSRVRIIDASTAHRTLPDWAYGFPELSEQHRLAIENGARVAVPGCHASGFIALVYPLLAAGVLDKSAALSCVSITGYSGGGKAMIHEYEATQRPQALGSPRLYALAQQHKHLREMAAITGLAAPPVFQPMVADYPCGMLLTIPMVPSMLAKKHTASELQALYTAHYEGCKLMHVLPCTGENAFMAANAFAGRDSMEISVQGNDERFVLSARYDNLGKGASGAAIECMNIMLGMEETTGLAL